MENSKERQLDSVFTAKTTGEYSFCFNNEMSTFAEKMVDFEIAVRGSCPDAGRMLLALRHSHILLQCLPIGNMCDRTLTLIHLCRLKMSLPPPSCPPKRVHLLNKPPLLRSPS